MPTLLSSLVAVRQRLGGLLAPSASSASSLRVNCWPVGGSRVASRPQTGKVCSTKANAERRQCGSVCRVHRIRCSQVHTARRSTQHSPIVGGSIPLHSVAVADRCSRQSRGRRGGGDGRDSAAAVRCSVAAAQPPALLADGSLTHCVNGSVHGCEWLDSWRGGKGASPSPEARLPREVLGSPRGVR